MFAGFEGAAFIGGFGADGLGFIRRLVRLGSLPVRKVRDQQLDFVAKTIEIGRECEGLGSAWMSGGITNVGDHCDGASQDSRQSIGEAFENGMETPALGCRVVLP